MTAQSTLAHSVRSVMSKLKYCDYKLYCLLKEEKMTSMQDFFDLVGITSPDPELASVFHYPLTLANIAVNLSPHLEQEPIVFIDIEGAENEARFPTVYKILSMVSYSMFSIWFYGPNLKPNRQKSIIYDKVDLNFDKTLYPTKEIRPNLLVMFHPGIFIYPTWIPVVEFLNKESENEEGNFESSVPEYRLMEKHEVYIIEFDKESCDRTKDLIKMKCVTAENPFSNDLKLENGKYKQGNYVMKLFH